MSKKILIVDYERNSIEHIREILRGEDFSLLSASDGQQALQAFEKNVPDLVLTAALLPKLNGFELCKKITNGQLGEVRPVIMYSAIYKAEKYRKEAIFGCGAIDFLEKPIPKWQLMKVIKSAFSEIPGPQPQVKKEGLTNLPEILDEPQALTVGVPLPRVDVQREEELLDVDALFKEEKSSPHLNKISEESTLKSGTRIPTQPQFSTIAAIGTDEIEAALDAFRIDLEKEINLREERRAQELEEELLFKEENILEFEECGGSGPSHQQVIAADSVTDSFELDGIEVEPLQNQNSISSSPATETKDRVLTSFERSKPEGFKYWVPLILLGVVIFFLLLFWIR